MHTATHPRATIETDEHLAIARTVLQEVFGPPGERSFSVRFWDGSAEGPAADDAEFVLLLKHPGSLRHMLLPPSEISIGEAFLRDDFDVSGSLEAATGLDEAVKASIRSPARLARLVRLLRSLPDGPDNATGRDVARLDGRRHSVERDRVAVRAHYDVGNEFYRLWLDRNMVYSCAYFRSEHDDLDTAQVAKLDTICHKLRLRPGERLLDIGCGWGSLVMHAAARYGVEATGITLSEPQAALARARIADAGLADRCRIEVRDYRELSSDTKFDKIASIGMVEHVGRSQLEAYFREVFRLLEPGGIFLNHGIVELPGSKPRGLSSIPTSLIWRPRSFIGRHVFPDGELIPYGELVLAAERSGFETRDVESLREHYALTLRHWVRRLEACREEAIALVGEPTYRVWRLYMAGSARAFATARLSVVQTLLGKPDQNGRTGVPLTRADLFA